MRLLFVSRPSLFSHPGGDTLHVEQTAEHIRRLGHEVEIATYHFIEPKGFDVIHFFNLGQPAPVLPYLRKAPEIPLVVSSVFVDYSTVENPVAGRKERMVAQFNYHWQEYFKTLARTFKGQEQLPHWEYIIDGQKASVKNVLDRAAVLIGASDWEVQHVVNSYGFKGRREKITVGVEHVRGVNTKLSRSNKRVLCAARFEPLKNQHRLISACRKLELPLHLVGRASRNHRKYFNYCFDLAGGDVVFHGKLTRTETLNEITQAKIHAMPSFYESTGLSTLEALYCGCQVVVGNHPIQRELFAGHAHFANPNSELSIQEAILEAMANKENHQSWVKQNFSWSVAALKIVEIYRDLV